MNVEKILYGNFLAPFHNKKERNGKASIVATNDNSRNKIITILGAKRGGWSTSFLCDVLLDA